jgi:hypothetical protein
MDADSIADLGVAYAAETGDLSIVVDNHIQFFNLVPRIRLTRGSRSCSSSRAHSRSWNSSNSLWPYIARSTSCCGSGSYYRSRAQSSFTARLESVSISSRYLLATTEGLNDVAKTI